MMKNRTNTHSRLFSLLVMSTVTLTASFAQAQWPGWGGPNRDFKSDAKGLADSWPETGPKQLWSRDLGDGYSSIAVDGGQLYTMYRNGDDEVVVAMNAKDGKTVWEYKYDSGVKRKEDAKDKEKDQDKKKSDTNFETRYGTGPNSTPLIHGGKVYTLGVNGLLHCLDQKTGKIIWSQDLIKDHGAKYPDFGFSSSPIVYKNTLISAVGGEGSGMMAFDLNSGSVIWKKNDFLDTYASPILIQVGGQDQVVLLTDREVVGVDPTNGDLLWQHEHVNQWKTNINTPLWNKKGLLYITAGGEAGSRLLKIKRKGNKTEVKEVWANKKMALGQCNVIEIDDHYYGFTGGHQGAIMSAIDAKTGKIAWRERGYKRSMMVHADGKLIIIDEDGNLSLAKATPKEFKVLSKAELFKNKSWTIPTVVGKTLYIRDKKTVMALDIG